MISPSPPEEDGSFWVDFCRFCFRLFRFFFPDFALAVSGLDTTKFCGACVVVNCRTSTETTEELVELESIVDDALKRELVCSSLALAMLLLAACSRVVVTIEAVIEAAFVVGANAVVVVTDILEVALVDGLITVTGVVD